MGYQGTNRLASQGLRSGMTTEVETGVLSAAEKGLQVLFHWQQTENTILNVPPEVL